MTLPPRVKLALVAVAILLFLLVAFIVVLPGILLNHPDARAAIQHHLSTALGGEIGFDRVKLRLFPWVCATVEHPRLDVPDRVSAQAEEIHLCLKFLPLLTGRVVLDSVKAQSPEIHLPIARIDSTGGGLGFPDPRLLMARMADRLKQIPGSVIEVADGRVELEAADGRRFEFRNLNLRLHPDGERIEWSLRCESEAFESFSSGGLLEKNSLRGTSAIQFVNLRPHRLQAFFLPDAPFQVLDGHVDMEMTVALEGPGRATATIGGKAPALAFGYSHRVSQLSVERFAAQLEFSETRLAASVSELSTRTPRAALELAFVVDEKAHPKIEIDLKGRGDLTGARDFTLSMWPETPEALLICDILRSGEVPQIHVNLRGDTWDDLTDLENLQIKGRLENGRVYLPWIDLDLNEVCGNVLIKEGVLEGDGLEAHYQGIRGENGRLRVGLSPTDPVLWLDIDARAELSALPAFLVRVVPDSKFRKEVARLQEFSGTAQGSLQLNGTHADVRVGVQASGLDVKARHQGIPYLLRFQGGEFSYDGDAITLRGVDVAVGDSKLFKHDMTIALNGDLLMESSSPKAVIDLADVFNLFRDLPPFNHLHRLEGIATFDNWRLSGQAFDPATWKLMSGGTLQDLAVDSEVLPGLLSLPLGNFDWRERTIRYQGAKGSISRSEINGLEVQADWTGPPRIQLRALEMDALLEDILRLIPYFPRIAAYAAALQPLEGTIRMRDLQFQANLLPEGARVDLFEAAVKTSVIASVPLGLPLTLTSGEIGWHGSTLTLHMAQASVGNSVVENLSIAGDWGIDGDLELRADKIAIEFGEVFPRMLSRSGMESLRDDVRDLQGHLTAFQVRLGGPVQDPGSWRIHALSEFKDIVVTTTFLDDPIELPMGRLTFSKNDGQENGISAIHLDSTRIRIGADAAVLTGDIALSAADTMLDLDIRAEAVDWKKIEKLSDRIAKHRQAESRPVHGRLDLRVERLEIEQFSLNPLDAEARLTSDGTHIKIERAGLCGMTFIGRLAFNDPFVDAYLVPVVDVVPLDSVVSCLTRETSIYTGTFNLNGALTVRARREDIIKALNGRLTLVAEDGTIRRSVLFARLFALLNLTEIYRGTLPDFDSEGLDYKRLSASIEVQDGKIRFNDWTIDGRTLWIGSRGEIDIATQQIDFTIMVSPFKTIDRIINSIPGLRWILGGRLVAIPMRAVGSLENPEVVPLSPSAVGTSIVELIERTLLLPIQVIQPLVPGMEATPRDTISR